MTPRGDGAFLVERTDLGLAAACLALALAYFALSLNRFFEVSDEGLILYHSARTAAGELPYRDFHDTYGPGVLSVTGLLLRAFGGSVLPLKCVLACLKALAVALTFLLCRFVVPRSFALLGAAIATVFWGRASWNLNTPYAAIYTIPLCLLGCFLLIHALRTDSRAAYALAGLVGGAAILFKQTLGVMNAVGMVLAVSATTALSSGPAERSRRGAVPFLLLWVAAAVAFELPVWRLVRPTDYLVHFLPLHLFMALVAAAVVVRGGCAPLVRALGGRLCPLVVGLAALPALAAAFYLWAGAFDALVFNSITLPPSLVNYYLPVGLPPAGRCLVFAGVVGLVSAASFALHGRRLPSWLAGVVGLALLAAAAVIHPHDALGTILGPMRRSPADSTWPVILWTLPPMIEGIVPAMVLLAATALLSPLLLSTRCEGPAWVLQAVLPLVFLQVTMIYQVFPRASFNVWLIQGATAPLLTFVGHRWYRLGEGQAASRRRKLGAALLVSAVPVWLAAPTAYQLFLARRAPGVAPLQFPQARGMRMSEFDRRVGHVDELEALVAYLRAAEPADAAVLPISIDMMMLYASGRRHLFPELDYDFFLLGLGMLPPSERVRLANGALGRRLAGAPDTIVVIRRDAVEARMLSALVELRDTIERGWAPVATFGAYSVLRRRAPAAPVDQAVDQ